MHIQRHTHTSTHVQSANKRNGDNQAQEPGRERRKKGFVRDLAHTHKKNVKKTDIHESKERIRAHRASSKATRLFLTKYEVIKATSINIGQTRASPLQVGKTVHNFLGLACILGLNQLPMPISLTTKKLAPNVNGAPPLG